MTHINFPTFNQHFSMIISQEGQHLGSVLKNLIDFDQRLIPSVQSSHLAFHVDLTVM